MASTAAQPTVEQQQESGKQPIPADLALPTYEELGIDTSADAVPKHEEQFIRQFAAGRDALLEKEESSRSDHAFRQSLSPLAKEACNIVSRVRLHEHNTLWTPEAASTSHIYPGMPFSLARERMEDSKLWRIVRKMPKGALLHSHFDAMHDVSWLVEQSIKYPGIALISDRPLIDHTALQNATVRFKYVGERDLKTKAGDAPVSIYSDGYKADEPVSAAVAASEFKASGEYTDFVTWLRYRHTINPEDALSPHMDVWAIWRKFAQCFGLVNSLITYEPIFRIALQRLFTELAEDGIRWAEFRYCFLTPFYKEGHTTPESDYMNMLIWFDQELGKFQDSPAGQKFWGARFIWTSLRAQSPEEIQHNMAECIRHKAMFPHLIAGYDLVGQEERGKTLHELLPLIFWFRKAVAAAELNIPFVFHAGETMETGSDTANNMYDAVLLGTRRIGHGFALYKHPLLLETVKSKNICIESCPLSNEILQLTGSVMAHPLPALLAKGVRCTISNDDPGILGGPHGECRNGSSRDMWSILQGWENLGLAGLGSLAEESVRFALFEVPGTIDETSQEWMDGIKKGINGTGLRADRLREWREDWNEFVEWIIVEYAADWGTAEDEEA